MPLPPSRLSQTFAADDDPELDEIIARAGPSEEDFLDPHSTAPSSSNQHANAPIPANRMALVRQIEEENRQVRDQQRTRELGFKALVVISIVTILAVASILFWLLYMAIIENPRQFAAAQHNIDLHRTYLKSGEPYVYGNYPNTNRITSKPKPLHRIRAFQKLQPRLKHHKLNNVRAGDLK